MSDLLNAERVTRVYEACHDPKGTLAFDGIAFRARYSAEKIAEHREEIREMLMELPEQFRETGGKGWSFLNACYDRHGELWTGEHRNMAYLFTLGQAANLVLCQFPRILWEALPGQMPYYLIKDREPK